MPKQPDKDKEKEKERKSTCVGCKKKFTKSDYCALCGMCNFWYHKTCAGMSDDVYKCVDQHFKDHGYTFWNCQPCSSYAKGITARMREIEGRLEEVERHQEKQDDRMKEMDGKVTRVDVAVKKLETKINNVAENTGDNVFQELHERHVRRYNVVFYGVGELEGDRPTVEEKRDWDAKSCQNIFDALNLRLKASSLRYLRRIGERGDKPRPLLVGMRTTDDKEVLLDNAKYLKDTHLSSVGISKDLTPQEIREEKEMEKEAERRNKDLNQEDRAKNLKWLVVGQKGEKRLIKTTERVGPTSQRGSRFSHGNRGRNPNYLPLPARNRANSKRGHSDSGSDEERGRSRISSQRKRPHTTADNSQNTRTVHTERTRTPVVEEEESGEEMEDGSREDEDEGTRTGTED
jgi:uncharacterized coiled-coil protein SlyX